MLLYFFHPHPPPPVIRFVSFGTWRYFLALSRPTGYSFSKYAIIICVFQIGLCGRWADNNDNGMSSLYLACTGRQSWSRSWLRKTSWNGFSAPALAGTAVMGATYSSSETVNCTVHTIRKPPTLSTYFHHKNRKTRFQQVQKSGWWGEKTC